MKDTYKILAIGTLLLVFVVGVYIGFLNKPTEVRGSIDGESGYNATSTLNMNGIAGLSARKQVQLDTTSGILGSITIASTSPAYFQIWNATSTTDVASSSIARFATSTAAGTYTFDAAFTRGLIIEMNVGFSGDYIPTWK